MAETTETTETTAAYKEAVAKSREASEMFRPIQDGYLGGWVDEAVYLAARADFKAAEAAFDAAWDIEVNRHR